MQHDSKVATSVRAAVANPIETALFIPEVIGRLREYQPGYVPDPDWEVGLHRWLGQPWPCPERETFDRLWHDIVSELEARGLRVGRRTYGAYSDAEQSLARVSWCTALHRRPSVVVETGVARGLTSRIVLEALDTNAHGHLWSIDLPHLFDKTLHAQTGAAVSAPHRKRWSYIEGSSRRRLRPLLDSLGPVDLFVHDSLHTARNTRFEMDHVLNVLTPGGIMIIDDISTHQGFATFTSEFPWVDTLVCPHSDREGSFFGLVHKPE